MIICQCLFWSSYSDCLWGFPVCGGSSSCTDKHFLITLAELRLLPNILKLSHQHGVQGQMVSVPLKMAVLELVMNSLASRFSDVLVFLCRMFCVISIWLSVGLTDETGTIPKSNHSEFSESSKTFPGSFSLFCKDTFFTLKTFFPLDGSSLCCLDIQCVIIMLKLTFMS